ncbi:MAG: hypothetical protein AB1765_13095 [Candidatus Hydrogenedentota bacterium]
MNPIIKIKIKDLKKNQKISRQELKKVIGGNIGTYLRGTLGGIKNPAPERGIIITVPDPT